MIWLVLIAILLPIQAHAVTVPHAFAERNTEFTTTSSTPTDITDAAISSGSFTTGKDYWILVCGQVSEESNGSPGKMRVLHGSTEFSESDVHYYRSSTTNEFNALCWFTVWTAVSSEGIKVQLSSTDNVSTARANFVSVFAMQLTDYLTNGTDYCFAESATDEALSTTADDGASCTVTPSASSTWLAMTYSQINRDTDITTRQISRMVRSGEASSSLPASNILPEYSQHDWSHFHARTFSFGASSNTIKEQSEAAATAHTRLHSSVFLLNLSKFSAHGAAYAEAALSLTSVSFVEAQTASITPTGTHDVLIGAAFVLDKTVSSSDVEFRVQVDGSDQPAGQTTAANSFDQYNVTHTGNDIPLGFMTMANLNNSAHTVDLDANRNTDSDIKYRQVWAFSLDIQESSTRRRTAQRTIE